MLSRKQIDALYIAGTDRRHRRQTRTHLEERAFADPVAVLRYAQRTDVEARQLQATPLFRRLAKEAEQQVRH